MNYSKNKDMIAGAFLLLVAVGYFLLSFQIKLSNIDRMVGSRLFPQICGVLLALFSCGLIAGNIMRNRRESPADAGEEAKDPAARPVYRNTILVLVSYAAFIWALNALGFVVSTVAYLFTQMIILRGASEKSRYFLYAVITALSTIAIYYLFNNVFYLILPKGNLF